MKAAVHGVHQAAVNSMYNNSYNCKVHILGFEYICW